VPVKTAGHAKKQILQRNVAEIAEERLKDIAGFVMRELKAAKFSTKLPCGIVLTGGSAYLSNIDQLFARELKMEVRFGLMLNGVDDESQQSVRFFPQSAVVGLLLYGAKHNACETSPEIVRPISTTDSGVTPTPENPTEQKTDIFTNVPPIAVPSVEEVVKEPQVEVEPKEEHEVPKFEDKPKEEHEVPKFEEKPKAKEPKSGWLDRFRNWVDDMFTDEYI
jgi:cell division protein FtsA